MHIKNELSPKTESSSSVVRFLLNLIEEANLVGITTTMISEPLHLNFEQNSRRTLQCPSPDTFHRVSSILPWDRTSSRRRSLWRLSPHFLCRVSNRSGRFRRHGKLVGLETNRLIREKLEQSIDRHALKFTC
jgi:hypothetical protein